VTVEQARVADVLDRLVVAHADLGDDEFCVRSACCSRSCCGADGVMCWTSGCCSGLAGVGLGVILWSVRSGWGFGIGSRSWCPRSIGLIHG
jgi:hypothetical protein